MSIATIILCAGKSTRMKSNLSKMLHPVCGKPLCTWSIEHALELSSAAVVVVVGHQAEAVQEALDGRYPNRISFALQAVQNGTGDAVKIALNTLKNHKGTVLITYGDTPLLQATSLKRLCDLREQTQTCAALLTAWIDDPAGYGRIVRNSEGQITAIVEHNDATPEQKQINEFNPGIYAFDADFLRESLGALTTNNAKHEYYLTDLIALAAKQRSVQSIEVASEDTLGINDRIQLAEANRVMQQRITKHWMQEGVSCQSPESITIDAGVKLGLDVTIEPGVRLLGKTQIGSNVVLGAGSILNDTRVDDDARIHPYSVCDRTIVGKKSEVGPFARLRPETRLDESTKIGNFVEVKKSHFKKGAKANHLAYIGDAEVGERSNIGAGTITCNYDGFAKHRTLLGDDVFIGSNSTLVAPLSIEAQAYVAAGSTINRDVPGDALAISRGRQENKEGYAARIRSRLKKRP